MIIREATIDDTGEICAMAEALERYMETLGAPATLQFNAEMFRHDAFGEEPFFYGLVAESDRGISGYLLYHFGYDFDRAKRIIHIIHLYVRSKDRRKGMGRALMDETAKVCREAGGIGLKWEVFPANEDALKFYDKLGAINTQNVAVPMYLPLK